MATSSNNVKNHVEEKPFKEKRERHPPHLRGRAVGMWYARRAQAQQSADATDLTSKATTSRKKERHQPLTAVELNESELLRMNQTSKLFAHEQVAIDENDVAEEDEDLKEHAIKFDELHQSFDYFKQLQSQPSINDQLLNDLSSKHVTSRTYKHLLAKRIKLPVYLYRQQILDTLKKNQIFVLVGETGSGKTTQIAQYILDNEIMNKNGSQCRIICSQPRRISATSVCERVANERGDDRIGDSVGYHIRLSAQFPRENGSILFCTTGMLLKYIEKYAAFEHFSHIILDEIHERDIQMDFLLIFIKRLVKIRQDLKVVLMSASIQAEKFSSYFDDCPIITVPGALYPIDEYYLEDYILDLNYQLKFNSIGRRQNQQQITFHNYMQELATDLSEKKYSNHVFRAIQNMGGDMSENINHELVVAVILHICEKSRDGTILVFLPGWQDIVKTSQLLRQTKFLVNQIKVLPLHSMIPLAQQHEIFSPAEYGKRKVILATSIAETSITIDDVVYVVDTGRTKQGGYDIGTGGKSLLPTWISRANLLQRKGRAGRTQPGICFRLFTRLLEKTLFLDFPQPEMTTTSLHSVYLQAKLLKINSVQEFLNEALDPPTIEAINHSESFLRSIDALTQTTNELTPIGRLLSHLPLDPQIGKLLVLGHIFSCFEPILTIASVLSYRDPFTCPMERIQELNVIRERFSSHNQSDHLMLIRVYDEWKDQISHRDKVEFCSRNFLNLNHMYMIDKMRKQLKYLISIFFTTTHTTNKNSENYDLIRSILCAGLYPNIARIHLSYKNSSKRPIILETKFDHRVLLHPRSVNSKLRDNDIRTSKTPSIYVIYHEKVRTNATYIHDASLISPYALLFFGKSIQTKDGVLIDDWINININHKSFKIVDELKIKFDYLLEQKASKKSIQLDYEHQLIDTIIQIITKQDRNIGIVEQKE